MQRYVLALVCGVITIFLFSWGYTTNISYSGIEHLPIYIGWLMLVVTAFTVVYALTGNK